MEKDLKEMFREKNRTILLTNLKYDLEKNIHSLLDTITNIFHLEFETAIKNSQAICFDSEIQNSKVFLAKTIHQMQKKSFHKVEKLLEKKKLTLEKLIDELEFSEECLNEYYQHVFQTTKDFQESFQKHIVDDIQKKNLDYFHQFVFQNVEKDKEELTILRITDYINNRLYGKLETKIHMELMLRDNNLINKAKESYIRYQEISSRTTES